MIAIIVIKSKFKNPHENPPVTKIITSSLNKGLKTPVFVESSLSWQH